MTTSTVDNSQRTAAKIAGFSLLLSMAIVVFANYVLLNPLMVPGNAAETARNIVVDASEITARFRDPAGTSSVSTSNQAANRGFRTAH